ncbi:B- and T-lymphocyte attenuator isoform X1 [Microtus ochrogaster]|uniref:B- and T-lymphocyte attenuator isoform X1 n=1 Tax=Microtus ochrogaster TaxID=79684 RepID=A0ABM0KEY8_MICOH|nr:B- and T-lymphocyte attenuator isoform X1 [Microtus ochrogaster]
MKTLPAMLGIPGLFSKLLILHVGFWSILGKAPAKRTSCEKPCQVQVIVPRHSEQATVGEFFKMECPVTYCAQRPNVTWCKYSGGNCLPLEIGPQQHTGWEDKDGGSVFTLHFEPVYLSDDGSYSCSVNFNSEIINSNIICLHVTDRTQNYSEHHSIMSNIPGATNASGPPTMEERGSRTWLLYSLLPVVPLLLLLACFCLVCFLKRHQGKGKNSDSAGKEINLVDIAVSPRENSQTLPSETAIYDNDPWSSGQESSESTTNPQSEGNKQGVVYASLKHSIIGRNPRQSSSMQEAPTEYASICRRS